MLKVLGIILLLSMFRGLEGKYTCTQQSFKAVLPHLLGMQLRGETPPPPSASWLLLEAEVDFQGLMV